MTGPTAAEAEAAAKRSDAGTVSSNSSQRRRNSASGSSRPRDELSVEAWDRLRAVAHDRPLLADTRALMDEAGVTLATVKALRLLPEDEPLSMRKLAARLQCDNSYVTSVVDVLEERGLARREGHPTDRRIKVIVLTDAGRALARRAQAIASRPPASFAALSDSEVATLCRLLRKLDTGEGRPPF